MTPEEEVEKELCPDCQGEGKVVIGEHRVTLDMAIDAGDRSMEGTFHSFEYAPCGACDGEGLRETYRSLESRLRKIAEGLRLNIDTLNRTREKSIEIGKEELESLLALAKGETNG